MCDRYNSDYAAHQRILFVLIGGVESPSAC